MKSIFSIDVEDWFNISLPGVEPEVERWDGIESRVERNFLRLMDLCAEYRVQATCFFLGYVAQRFPHLVRRAAADGHEIASHGFHHRLVYTQEAEAFQADARRARLTIEDIAGAPVLGYRAAAFSINERTPWFFDKLTEAGYRYDSSVFPAPHRIGGVKTSRLQPHTLDTTGGPLAEFPITAVKVAGKTMCFFGGGYLRLFPYALIKPMAHRALREGRPVVFYIHPREVDPRQPRLPMGRKDHFKTYVNLRTTEPKLRRIFRDFEVTTFRNYLETTNWLAST
ncbi:MAG: XrtA system polysaccharide deacetylase [Burkholderiales bacterium]